MAERTICLPPSLEQIANRLLVEAGLGAMLRQQLWLCSREVGELIFQSGRYPRMNLLAPTAQQCAVGGVLHEGMLEGVLSIGRHPAPEDQFGAHKLLQRIIKAVLRHLSDGTDQLVRERASKRRADLSDLACRR